MYYQETRGIVISVRPSYAKQHSAPLKNVYVWIYEIEIHNKTVEMLQLLNRHWLITDADANVEKVDGPGVVGLQPLIGPGEKFSYNSFCALKTNRGKMQGSYEMQNIQRERFSIAIPEFVLASPSHPLVSRHLH